MLEIAAHVHICIKTVYRFSVLSKLGVHCFLIDNFTHPKRNECKVSKGDKNKILEGVVRSIECDN